MNSYFDVIEYWQFCFILNSKQMFNVTPISTNYDRLIGNKISGIYCLLPQFYMII